VKKKPKASRKIKRIENRKVIVKQKGKGGFVTHFTHGISGHEIWASDYGYKAFPLSARK
jgi:hypothetical protein